MPICVRCRQEKRTDEMLRDKYEPGTGGLAVVCRECGKLPGMLRMLKSRRDRNAYNARRGDPEVMRALEVHAACRAELATHFAVMQTVCVRCRETKVLEAFPVSRYGPLRHSGTCKECWAADPDGKQELIRERARDWSRAQALRRPNETLRSDHDRDIERRYLARREKDTELQDYREFGYERAAWNALGKEGRDALRKAAIIRELGAL